MATHFTDAWQVWQAYEPCITRRASWIMPRKGFNRWLLICPYHRNYGLALYAWHDGKHSRAEAWLKRLAPERRKREFVGFGRGGDRQEAGHNALLDALDNAEQNGGIF